MILRLAVFLLSLSCAFGQEKKQELMSLLTDMDVQIDMTDAVNNMYNFKFPQAEAEFLKLRDKFPHHPMPYFLMGLSNFWKMQPNEDDTQYDEIILAYMDTSILYAEPMLESKEEKILVEGNFFLSAAYGFKGRVHSERFNMVRAMAAGKKAMYYMQSSKNNADLSPEFLFGDGLYNYYAEWIPKNYPVLKPVVALFPKGNIKLGIDQLNFCANNAFFTRTEAQSYLMLIYKEEKNMKMALNTAKYLHSTFPDNPYFQRLYCRFLFTSGNFVETERVALSILAKIDSNYTGYEPISGRYASYFLGYISEFKKDTEKAKMYFKRTVEFSEKIKAFNMAYYFYACAHLAKILAKEGKVEEACFYYQKVKKNAEKGQDDAILTEAKDFIKKHDCAKEK